MLIKKALRDMWHVPIVMLSTTLPGIRVTAECDLDWFCKADKEGVEAGGDASEAQPVTLPTEPELSGPAPDLSTARSFGHFDKVDNKVNKGGQEFRTCR